MPERVDSRVRGTSRRLEAERGVPTFTLQVIAAVVLAFWGLALYLVLSLF